MCQDQGYRNRYDIIDHGHKKNDFYVFFQSLWKVWRIQFFSNERSQNKIFAPFLKLKRDLGPEYV